MKFRLVEFAYDRRKIEDILVNKSPEILEHLIKIYFYPGNDNTNHWKDEIYSFINRVPKIKFNNTFGVWGDTIPNIVDKVLDEYGDSNREYNMSDCLDFCSRYFTWLSNELSSKGLISKKDVYEIIDNLLHDY